MNDEDKFQLFQKTYEALLEIRNGARERDINRTLAGVGKLKLIEGDFTATFKDLFFPYVLDNFNWNKFDKVYQDMNERILEFQKISRVYAVRLTPGYFDMLIRELPERTGLIANPIFGFEEDFLSLSGRALVVWGHFIPFGPAMAMLLLVKKAGLPGWFLGYRCLNPFSQEGFIFGRILDEYFDLQKAIPMVLEAFALNSLGNPEKGGFWLIDNAPTFVHWEEPALEDAAFRMFSSNPVLASTDLYKMADSISEYFGRPWERESATESEYLRSLFRSLGQKQVDLHLPPEAFSNWFGLVTDPEHRLPELDALSEAWETLTRPDPEKASTEVYYTLAQLKSFLRRYDSHIFPDEYSPAESLGGQPPGAGILPRVFGPIFRFGSSLLRRE